MKKHLVLFSIGLIAAIVSIVLIPQTVRADWSSGTFSISYTVNAPAAPTLSFTASPASVAYGGSSTLSWSSTNATSCTASQAWSGSKALSGSTGTGAMSSNQTYKLTCSGPGGSVAKSVTVSVGAPPAPTVSLTASPTSVAYGGSSTLSWSSTNATSCTASQAWSGTKATSGSTGTGSMTATQTYTLTCTGAGGSASSTAVVSVGAPAVPTVSFTAAAYSVPYNSATTLYWSSANTTSCTASNAWTGAKAVSGNQSTGALTSAKTYSISCTGPGGTVSANVTINVGTAPPATPTGFWAGPSACDSNWINLSWNAVSGATSYTVKEGSRTVYSGTALATSDDGLALGSHHNYTVVASNAGGTSAAAQTSAYVAENCVPVVTLTASPTSLNVGNSTTLATTVKGLSMYEPPVCSGNFGEDLSMVPHPTSWTNSTVIYPPQTTTYTVTCSNGSKTGVANATVTVNRDLCFNVSGEQLTVPSGKYRDGSGNCYDIDVCPNIGGTQAAIPVGMYMYGSNCIPAFTHDTCPMNGVNATFKWNVTGATSCSVSRLDTGASVAVNKTGNCATVLLPVQVPASQFQLTCDGISSLPVTVGREETKPVFVEF